MYTGEPNNMTSYLITCWPTFYPQNRWNPPRHAWHKFLVDDRRYSALDVQALVTHIRNFPKWLSSKQPFHDTRTVLSRINIGPIRGLGLQYYKARIQYYIPSTNRAQFESYAMERCFSRRFHFHFGRQIICKNANGPQWCSYSLWRSWSVSTTITGPRDVYENFP